MNTHADKKQKNKSQSAANKIAQKKGNDVSPFQFVDNRPETVTQRKLQEIMANNSQQSIQKKASPESSRKENNTGLPDNLKSGMENLSGISLDDVKVHRNSDKPAQLQAHAFAQGNQIHLASGQEKHLPHEAWHVVQQKQGRVKPTTQLKGTVNINDDVGLEKEADMMGEKSLQMNSSLSAIKSSSEINKPTVQRQFNSALDLNDPGTLIAALREAGYEVNKGLALRSWFGQEFENTERMLNDIPSIAAAIIEYNPGYITPPDDGAGPSAAPPVTMPSREVIEREAKAREIAEVEAAAREAAEREFERREAEAREARERKTTVRKPTERKMTIREETARREGASSSADATEEEGDTSPLIINYVWLGDRKLGAMEKFNIHSWRALGDTVNIYALRFDGEPPTAGSLGIDKGDANVIDLGRQLGIDDEVAALQKDGPKAILSDARGLLGKWFRAIPRDGEAPSKALIYNMVDVVKSYIGGTQRGIVLDTKVGPSEHLPAFRGSFNNHFISYSRGGKSTAAVENQSMGTMQEGDGIRSAYAQSFNANVRMNEGIGDQPNESWFNLITSFHGRAFGKPKAHGLDVATQSPTEESNEGRYPVSEPIEPGQGPFRVFKAAGEQSNQGGAGLTKPEDIFRLAEEVFDKQLASLEDSQGFVGKAYGDMEALAPQ